MLAKEEAAKALGEVGGRKPGESGPTWLLQRKFFPQLPLLWMYWFSLLGAIWKCICPVHETLHTLEVRSSLVGARLSTPSSCSLVNWARGLETLQTALGPVMSTRLKKARPNSEQLVKFSKPCSVSNHQSKVYGFKNWRGTTHWPSWKCWGSQ